MKQEESALKEGWTSSCRTSVGAAGNLKVVDHTLKHLLYEEEDVVVNQMNGLAVEDSAGNSAGSSGSSGTYYTATESGEGGRD